MQQFQGGELGTIKDQSKNWLVGSDLIFAVGEYSHERMQVNHYNSLHVELYSKLEDELELESISLHFSGLKHQLNHKV